MSTTKVSIKITKADGWVEVLSVSGFVVVNSDHDFEFFYLDSGVVGSPSANTIGNLTSARIIDNNSTSKLYIRTVKFDLTVIPNEE